jgi:hypothetical protein
MKLPSLSHFAVLVLFMLPFMDITCQQHKLLTLNGYDLAFGTEIQPPKLFSEQQPKKEKIPATPILIGVLLTAVVGGLVSLQSAKVGGFLGIVAAVLLLVFQMQAQTEARQKGEGILGITLQVGYWASLVAAAAAAFTGFATKSNTKEPT